MGKRQHGPQGQAKRQVVVEYARAPGPGARWVAVCPTWSDSSTVISGHARAVEMDVNRRLALLYPGEELEVRSCCVPIESLTSRLPVALARS